MGQSGGLSRTVMFPAVMGFRPGFGPPPAQNTDCASLSSCKTRELISSGGGEIPFGRDVTF